jgi:hypothetical protein
MDTLIPVLERRCAGFVGDIACKRVFAGRLVKMGVDAQVTMRHRQVVMLKLKNKNCWIIIHPDHISDLWD